MTLPELQTYVWRRLGVRKYLTGRGTVDDLVQLAVENYADDFLRHCRNDEERTIVAGVIVQNMRRAYELASGKPAHEYGMWWAFVLQAVASSVVQLIIRWWLERRTHRVYLACIKADLTR